MPDDGDDSRFVAVCENCGAAFAAMETEGGDRFPMGSRTGCSCGCAEFSRLDPDDVTDSS